jgi:hypothetical protein
MMVLSWCHAKRSVETLRAKFFDYTLFVIGKFCGNLFPEILCTDSFLQLANTKGYPVHLQICHMLFRCYLFKSFQLSNAVPVVNSH